MTSLEPFPKEKPKSFKSPVFLALSLLPFISFCKDQKFSSCQLVPAQSKTIQQLLMRTSPSMGILLETDTNGDGKINDWLWMKGEESKREETKLFFNEIRNEKGLITEEIWYGPGNQKLVGKSDLNGDGKLETTVYYNRNAKPKVVQGIVARMEVDLNSDGKPEYWLYPGLRVEIDSTGNGEPNEFTENPEEMQKILTDLEGSKKISKTFQALPGEKSYTLHPELIKGFSNQSVIQKSL